MELWVVGDKGDIREVRASHGALHVKSPWHSCIAEGPCSGQFLSLVLEEADHGFVHVHTHKALTFGCCGSFDVVVHLPEHGHLAQKELNGDVR